MFRNQHKNHVDRGAAAVEMALVLPLLLLVLFGLIDFGRAFNAQMQLTQAAREGVRVIALGGFANSAAALDAAQTRARLAMPASGGSTAPTVDISSPASNWCTAGTVTGKITVHSTFTFLTPLGPIAGWFGATTIPGAGQSKTLSAEGVMRCSG